MALSSAELIPPLVGNLKGFHDVLYGALQSSLPCNSRLKSV